MRVLFVNFEGVLHTDETYVAGGKLTYLGPGQLFEYAPVLERLIAPYPDLALVLTTTWVKTFGIPIALQALPQSLRTRVIGTTFNTTSQVRICTVRYEQVLGYVDRHRLSNWLVLDAAYDASWPKPFLDRLVRTESQLCLGEPRAQEELTAKLKEMMT